MSRTSNKGSSFHSLPASAGLSTPRRFRGLSVSRARESMPEMGVFFVEGTLFGLDTNGGFPYFETSPDITPTNSKLYHSQNGTIGDASTDPQNDMTCGSKRNQSQSHFETPSTNVHFKGPKSTPDFVAPNLMQPQPPHVVLPWMPTKDPVAQ